MAMGERDSKGMGSFANHSSSLRYAERMRLSSECLIIWKYLSTSPRIKYPIYQQQPAKGISDWVWKTFRYPDESLEEGSCGPKASKPSLLIEMCYPLCVGSIIVFHQEPTRQLHTCCPAVLAAGFCLGWPAHGAPGADVGFVGRCPDDWFASIPLGVPQFELVGRIETNSPNMCPISGPQLNGQSYVFCKVMQSIYVLTLEVNKFTKPGKIVHCDWNRGKWHKYP